MQEKIGLGSDLWKDEIKEIASKNCMELIKKIG